MAATAGEIEELYRARRAGFRNAAAAVLGDREAARDAVQDGFATALARRGSFRGGSLEAWVWRIVLRKALDRRRAPVERPLEDDFDVGLVRSDGDPEVAAAIRALAPRRRLMVFLRYFGDLSYEAIADLCGVTPGTVGAALAQAHDELRSVLELEGADR